MGRLIANRRTCLIGLSQIILAGICTFAYTISSSCDSVRVSQLVPHFPTSHFIIILIELNLTYYTLLLCSRN